MIVDAQAHVWAADRPDRPWPRDAGTATQSAHSAAPVGAAQTLRVLDAAGVAGAVLVPPSWEGDRNDLALAAARAHPDRFAVMGRVPLSGTTRPGTLDRWRDEPGLAGIRVTLHREPWRSAFLHGGLDWLWAAADHAALPVMVYAPGLSGLVGGIARRHSGLRLIVDHLAVPVASRGREAFTGLSGVIALARFPSVAVKATALPCHSEDRYPFADLHGPLHRVVEAFGPSRVFWGSDWTRLPCSYQDNVRLFTEELPFLSGTDLEAVMGAGLQAWIGWPAASPTL